MKKIAILAAALFAFALPAKAADAPIAYKAAPVFNWTGFYVGAHVGYGWADSGLGDLDGFLGGVQAGYNWQMSRNWVFGVEGDISATDMNIGVAGIPIHVDYLATTRARMGYAIDRTMFYVTGGFAFTRIGALGVHLSDEGYALGFGVEHALSRNWSAKVEYMYYDIGAFETSALKLGVNYRF